MKRLIISCVGITGIVAIMSVALLNGQDGAYLALSFTAIGGIVGFTLGKRT